MTGYRETECRLLSPEELETELLQFGQPAERAWLREENPLFFWTWLHNLRRNCNLHQKPVPEWLESLLETAPPAESLASPPVVFAA